MKMAPEIFDPSCKTTRDPCFGEAPPKTQALNSRQNGADRLAIQLEGQRTVSIDVHSGSEHAFTAVCIM